MAIIEELKVKLGADIEEFQSKMREAGSSVGTSFIGLGTAMTVVGGAITAGTIGLAKAGGEWQASVEGQKFLMNNLDKSVQNIINTNSKYANSIGLTNQQYKNGATEMGNFYKNMGLNTKATGDLSEGTMQLVADLAAVTDMPFDDALSNFKSGLMGNMNAFDSLGIAMNVATIEQGDYCKELGKSWNEMSNAEKTQAIYNEAMRQGASANGLAKQEAGQFSMQAKLLKENLKETAGEIGSNLLPVLTPLIKTVSDMAKGMSNWVKEHPQLTQAIVVLVAALGLILAISGPLLVAWGAFTLAAAAFNVTILPTVGIVMGVVAGILLLIAAGVWLYQNWETVIKWCGELKEQLTKKWEEIKTKITETVTNLSNDVKKKWDEIKQAVVNKVEELKAQAQVKFEAFKTSVSNVWNNIKATASSIWDNIKSAIVNKIQEAKDGVVQKFNTIKGEVERIWNNVTSFLSGISLFSIGSNIVQGLIRGIQSAAGGVAKALGGIVDGAINKVKRTLGIASPSKLFKQFGAWTSEGLAIGIDKGSQDVLNASKDLSNNVIFGYQNGIKGADNKPIAQNGGITLHIENFNNNTDKDIKTLADELAYYLNRKKVGVY